MKTKTQTEKHTPTPWTFTSGEGKHKGVIWIKSGDVFIGKLYGHEGQPIEENKKFLDCAVNSHEALIDKAERLLEYLDEWSLDIPEEQAKVQRIVVKEMRNAIEGGEQS